MIQAGDKLPSVPVKFVTADGVSDVDTAQILGQGRVVLFGVPGAFTPTCDTSHLPGFVGAADRIKAAGIDRIVCATVNDHHVTKAWAERSDAVGKVDFIADARRFARFAMIVDHGVVRHVFVQDVQGVTVSGAPAILMALQGEAAA